MIFENSITNIIEGNSKTLGMIATNMKEFHESMSPEQLNDDLIHRTREKEFINNYKILEESYSLLKNDFDNLLEILKYLHYSIHKKVGENSCEFGDKCPFNTFVRGAPKNYPIQNVIQSQTPETPQIGGGQGNK